LFSGLLIWAVGSVWAGAQTRPAPGISSDVSLVPVVGATKEELLRSLIAKNGGVHTFRTAQPQDCVNGTPSIDGSTCNSTNSGQLANTDCFLSDNSYYDVYSFSGIAGQQVAITMSSSAFDTFLFLVDTSASNTVATDHDGGGGTTSRIVYTLDQTGTWFIVANSFLGNQFGPYTLTLACVGGPTPTPTVIPTSTPTPAAPREIPTLSFPMLALLALVLAALAIGVLRQF